MRARHGPGVQGPRHKLLPTALTDQPGYREQLRSETHAAAQSTEPHVIPIFDTFEEVAASPDTPATLNFVDLFFPYGVAVDTADNVYVADFHNRVLKLPAR